MVVIEINPNREINVKAFRQQDSFGKKPGKTGKDVRRGRA
jgi:hypothetical protein